MDELPIKDEQVLLVVKYEPLKVMWRIFFPHIFVILIGFSLGNRLLLSGNMTGGIFFSIMGITSFCLAFELLMIKEFVFYPDNIVKVWKLFGSKEIKYVDASLVITSRLGIMNGLSMYSFTQKMQRFYKSIVINRTMISANTENQIMDLVSKLLNQDIREQHKHSNILNFDIKNYL